MRGRATPAIVIEAAVEARAEVAQVKGRPPTERQKYALRLIEQRPRSTYEIGDLIGSRTEVIPTLAGLLARNKIELSNGFWWSVKEKERAA